MNSIIDSVNQSKKASTVKEKEVHEKTNSISKLRFNSDDRLSRVGEYLSFSKCLTMEFDMAHDARYIFSPIFGRRANG